MADRDWKDEHANASSKSIEHGLVEDVIAEFMSNVGIADTGLPAYGIRKVALYAAQVARADALGFDPELLRMTAEEATSAQLGLAAQAVLSGVPVRLLDVSTLGPDEAQTLALCGDMYLAGFSTVLDCAREAGHAGLHQSFGGSSWTQAEAAPMRSVELEHVCVDENGDAPDPTLVHHVGWGGSTRVVRTDMDLGRGKQRTPLYGLRRAVWDAAFGYVSGFRKRDIAYYMLTRSFSRRLEHHVIEWEHRTGRARSAS